MARLKLRVIKTLRVGVRAGALPFYAVMVISGYIAGLWIQADDLLGQIATAHEGAAEGRDSADE